MTTTRPSTTGSSTTAVGATTGDDVVLVDDDGAPVGRAPRSGVHTTDTPLHLAFSVHLFDDAGRVLLTRRAVTKTTWPGVWTNSCCGHQRPGEAITDTVHRRVREELGVEIDSVREELPQFRYRAVDASGLVENEICPVFSARVRDEIRPDPAEVCEYTWVDWESYVTSVQATPAVFSPWSVLQVPQLHERRRRDGRNPAPTRAHGTGGVTSGPSAARTTEAQEHTP